MPIILGMFLYQIQVFWFKIFPQKKLVVEYEEWEFMSNTTAGFVTVVIKNRKSGVILSKTRVAFLADDSVKKIQQPQGQR